MTGLFQVQVEKRAGVTAARPFWSASRTFDVPLWKAAQAGNGMLQLGSVASARLLRGGLRRWHKPGREKSKKSVV